MEDFEDGDVVVFNHPYAGNVTHPNDTVVLMPVFAQGQLVAFTATLAHKADLGGPRQAHVPQDIWEEGLVIPPTKLYVRGKVNPEIERFIAANSRIPVETLGDLRGQVAACRVGAERVQELCERFGVDTVRDGCGELMARVAGTVARCPRRHARRHPRSAKVFSITTASATSASAASMSP